MDDESEMVDDDQSDASEEICDKAFRDLDLLWKYNECFNEHAARSENIIEKNEQ